MALPTLFLLLHSKQSPLAYVHNMYPPSTSSTYLTHTYVQHTYVCTITLLYPIVYVQYRQKLIQIIAMYLSFLVAV